MTDYAASDMGCLVVSERFKKFIDNLGIDNIEFFPATVIEKEGQAPKAGYYAANIIGLIECIDIDASEMRAKYNKEGELKVIFRIDSLVLNVPPKMISHYIERPTSLGLFF